MALGTDFLSDDCGLCPEAKCKVTAFSRHVQQRQTEISAHIIWAEMLGAKIGKY